jgi:hypothetical protein
MKKKLFLVLFLSCIGLGYDVIACSCLQPLSPNEAVDKAVAVFVGRVVLGEVREFTLKGPNGKDIQYQRRNYRFQVEEVIKGSLGRTVEVHTGIDSAQCGYSFDIGNEYLVYAHGPSTKDLWISSCSRTKSFNIEGQKELKQLKDNNRGSP